MRALRSGQRATVLLLSTGYAAYYFCRADFSVAMPLLVDELRRHGMSGDDAVIRLGAISSFGVLAYALGKMLFGGLGDLWGGRRSFLLGLAGATLFTLVFAAGGVLPIFTLAWIGNRLSQSIGWPGAIKVCSKWFDYSSYGAILSILTLSYLIGDAVARQSMGLLIAQGYDWRMLFYCAAGVAGCLLIANFLFLRESRVETGHPEARAHPSNLFAGTTLEPRSLSARLRPLLTSHAFLLVCLLSLGCTVVRQTFSTWTPVYLRDFLGYTTSRAAMTSAVFPAAGAVSVVFTGWLSDRLGASGRVLLLFVGMAATALALLPLALMRTGSAGSAEPVVLIGVVAFCLLGPYSYLGGAIAMDFGGKHASAAAAGIIDGVGYLGGVLAGDTVARVSVAFGWRGVFVALAVVSALAALAAGYLAAQQRQTRPSHA